MSSTEIKFLDEDFHFRPSLLLNPKENPSAFTLDGKMQWEKLPNINWQEEFLRWITIPWVGVDDPHTNDSDALYCVTAGAMRAVCNLFNWIPLWNNFGPFLANDILPFWRTEVDQVVNSMYRVNEVQSPFPKFYVNIWLFDQKDHVLLIRKRADHTIPRYTRGPNKKDVTWIRPDGSSTPKVSATTTVTVVITLSVGASGNLAFCAVADKDQERPYDLYIRKGLVRLLIDRPWEAKPND